MKDIDDLFVSTNTFQNMTPDPKARHELSRTARRVDLPTRPLIAKPTPFDPNVWRKRQFKPFSITVMGKDKEPTREEMEKAKTYVSEAMNLLYQVRNAMSFRDLQQFAHTQRYTDGTEIRVKSHFGVDRVWIKPPQIGEEAAVEQITNPLVIIFEGAYGPRASYRNLLFFTWMKPEGGERPYQNFYIELTPFITLSTVWYGRAVAQPVEFYVPENNPTIGIVFIYDHGGGAYPNNHSAVKYKVTTPKIGGTDIIQDGLTYIEYNCEAFQNIMDSSGLQAVMNAFSAHVPMPTTMQFEDYFTWGSSYPPVSFWPSDSGTYPHLEEWSVSAEDMGITGTNYGTPEISGLNLSWDHTYIMNIHFNGGAFNAVDPHNVQVSVHVVETDEVLSTDTDGTGYVSSWLGAVAWGDTYETLDFKAYWDGSVTRHIRRRHTMTVTPSVMSWDGTITELDPPYAEDTWSIDSSARWAEHVQHWYGGNPVPTTYDWTQNTGSSILIEADSNWNWTVSDPCGMLDHAVTFILNTFGGENYSGDENGLGFTTTGSDQEGGYAQAVRAVYGGTAKTAIPLLEWDAGTEDQTPYTKKFTFLTLGTTITGPTYDGWLPLPAYDRPWAVQNYGKIDRSRIVFIDKNDTAGTYNSASIDDGVYSVILGIEFPDYILGREYWVAAEALGLEENDCPKAYNRRNEDEWWMDIYFSCTGYETLGMGYGLSHCDVGPNNTEHWPAFGVFVGGQSATDYFVPQEV